MEVLLWCAQFLLAEGVTKWKYSWGAPLFVLGEFGAGKVLLRLIVFIIFVIIELHQLR